MARKYCTDCGNQVMPTMRICPQCGSKAFSDTPRPLQNAASAQSPTQALSQSFQSGSIGSNNAPIYAGFWERLAASLIDSIVITFICYIAAGILGVGMTAFGMSVRTPRGEAFIMLVWWVMSLFYHASMEAGPQGATLGKRWMTLRVVNMHYQQISIWQAVGRFFGRVVSVLTIFFGYLIQPFTAHRQTLHDMMCGSLVVHSRSKPKSGAEVFATNIVALVLLFILLAMFGAIERAAR